MGNSKMNKSELVTQSVSVVIPVYNSENTLAELVERISATLRPLVQSLEIILVNDGSRDRSWDVMTYLISQYPDITGLNLMRNYSQHNALLVGILKAKNDIIVTIDDDLQNPPEEIGKLLLTLNQGYDIVYGVPKIRRHKGWRNISSKILKTVMKVVLGAELGGKSSAFRAFRSILRRGFENFTDAQLSIDVLLSWSAARVTNVTVDHQERKVGKSGYTIKKLFMLAFNMLTGYSILPLRIASVMGLSTSVLGLAMFLYVTIRRLVQTTYVPGFSWISAEIALFAGLQLFAIGVIGEYVASLHFRTMGKPAYVIREERQSESVSTRVKEMAAINEE